MAQAGSFVAMASSIAARSAVGGALLGSAVAPVVAIGAGERAEKERRELSAGDGEARGSRGKWGARWYDVRLTFVFLFF